MENTVKRIVARFQLKNGNNFEVNMDCRGEEGLKNAQEDIKRIEEVIASRREEFFNIGGANGIYILASEVCAFSFNVPVVLENEE